jgi:preprotein translocase subunit Sec63
MDLFKWVPRFIVFVFICIIVGWILIGILTFKGFSLVKEEGLKNIINKVWEGSRD